MIKVFPYNFNTKSCTGKSVSSSRLSAPAVSFCAAQRLLPEGKYPKKLIKLISLDIDGTISDRATNNVTQEVKDALKSVMDRGIKVVLNTARDYEDALKVAREIDPKMPLICNYGQFIWEEGKLIYRNPKRALDQKGDTLEYFAKQLGIKKENIMAIGDEREDSNMFKKAGTSVIMDGSYYIDEIIPYADYIVDNENNSGVALAIKKLVR